MMTVVKIPVYLKIETGIQDRAKVTKYAQRFLIPRIIAHWKSKGFAGYFNREEARDAEALMEGIDIELLTDVQAMVKRNDD